MTHEVHALPHVICILQQRLSDGGHIHVERALTWNDLRNLAKRDFEIGKMVEQVFAEVQTRCGLP